VILRALPQQSLIDIKSACKMLPISHFVCQPVVMPAAHANFATTSVRPATIDDAGAIAEIYAEHVRTGTASFDTAPRTSEETARKIDEIQAKGWPFLVAERGGEVVGYAYATQFRDRPAYRFACEDSIYVGADQIGRGVGTILMRELIAAATACGFRQMIAVVGGGEPGSVALHAKLGFEHAGRMRAVGRKFGRWLDSIYMQLELGEGDRLSPDREPE
jgi:L-amino acid N-acyltransferase YncA